MEKKEILETLQKLGLGEYESKAYATLSVLGPVKAGVLSREASIPQSKIYEVLETLTRKQLIEVLEGRPKEFKAVSSEVIIKSLLTEREQEIKALKEQALLISSLLKPEKPREEVMTGVWIQKGEKFFEFFDKLSETFDRAEKYVYAITRDFSYSHRLRDAVRGCIKRNVKLFIMGLEINENNYYKAKWYDSNGVPIKVFETKVHPRIAVVDGKEVSIRLDSNPLKKKFSFQSIWSEDPSLVAVFDSYMKNLWKNARPIDFKKIPAPRIGIEDLN
jgi:sugar-specific transcriptional regulator TrmB